MCIRRRSLVTARQCWSRWRQVLVNSILTAMSSTNHARLLAVSSSHFNEIIGSVLVAMTTSQLAANHRPPLPVTCNSWRQTPKLSWRRKNLNHDGMVSSVAVMVCTWFFVSFSTLFPSVVQLMLSVCQLWVYYKRGRWTSRKRTCMVCVCVCCVLPLACNEISVSVC